MDNNISSAILLKYKCMLEEYIKVTVEKLSESENESHRHSYLKGVYDGLTSAQELIKDVQNSERR